MSHDKSVCMAIFGKTLGDAMPVVWICGATPGVGIGSGDVCETLATFNDVTGLVIGVCANGACNPPAGWGVWDTVCCDPSNPTPLRIGIMAGWVFDSFAKCARPVKRVVVITRTMESWVCGVSGGAAMFCAMWWALSGWGAGCANGVGGDPTCCDTAGIVTVAVRASGVTIGRAIPDKVAARGNGGRRGKGTGDWSGPFDLS